MSEQYATSSCLSCLLDSRRELELYPEPYRLQPNMTFRVTLPTYTEYILSLPDSSDVKLLSPLKSLKELASVKSPKLYRNFLRDMSFALLKEISFAEEYKCSCTAILPAANTSNVLSVSYMLLTFGSVTDNIEYMLRELLESMRYPLPKKISECNKNLFDLAVILYRLSTIPKTVKETHFLYDIDTRKNS